VIAGGIGTGQPSQLFDGTESDSVGLAQGAIDGPCLRDTHFGPADQRRNVRGIGISVADKAFRAWRFVNGRLENPATVLWVTQAYDGVGMNAATRVPKT
jgi:hypothetical protein